MGVSALLLGRNHGFAGGMNLAPEDVGRRWGPEFFFLLNSDARVEECLRHHRWAEEVFWERLKGW